MATRKQTPIDPAFGPKFVLDGRIVTMNASFRVIERGRIYIADGTISAVREAGAAPPAGFDNAPLITTGATIFPGLIELHNHLSYNALPMWQVPRIFAHRGQWSSHPDKRRLISQPMSVLAGIGGTIEALVRYVETKCLIAGVTSSQGLTLMAAPTIEHKYRGIVRNVEATDDPTLPESLTRIEDVTDAAAFARRLQTAANRSLLLHLSEGIGPDARKHFLKLKRANGAFAITPALIGIHGVGLLPEDFEILADHGGHLVWSPLSNMLLYGGTADIKAAKAAGVNVALGSDWSPSGSKNLLSELKVAWAWSERMGGVYSARELVAMVTSQPARMLKWDGSLGSIEPGRRADFLCIKGRGGDPYEKLLKADEADVALVLINGIPRFGVSALMDKATRALFSVPPALETRKFAGEPRRFNFIQDTADPIVAQVSLATAEDRLRRALKDLPELAAGLANPATASLMLGVLGASDVDQPVRRWTLALDNEPHDEVVMAGTARPLAPDELSPGHARFGADALGLNAASSADLVSMELDALAIVEDDTYFERLGAQINLPDGFAAEIARLHGRTLSDQPTARVIATPLSDSPDQLEPTLPRSLAELRALPDALTVEDRITLVRQLRLVLEELYVHLPFKRAAHAIDPLQRLRLLEYALEQNGKARALQGLLFHQQIIEIFNELRDLHTAYMLPPPYSELTAFLPFLLERCFEPDTQAPDEHRPIYVVTKVADSLKHPTFVPGVEVLYWNGTPIEQAIERNADRQAGSNLAARFARGLAGMTVRPLARVLPPEEEWALMTYRAADSRVLEIRLPWQIRSGTQVATFEAPPLSRASLDASIGNIKGAVGRGRTRKTVSRPDFATLTCYGMDVQMEAVNVARRDLFAHVAAPRGRIRTARSTKAEVDLPTRMPQVLRARTVNTSKGKHGYLRIFSFSVPDADAFVAEIMRLIGKLSQRGLILDVRNNGGGLIWAAEQLLQLFTDRRIEPERAQFLNSRRVLDLVRRHAPSSVSPTLDLTPWVASVDRSIMTGAVHSEAFSITPPERANAMGRKYPGPVVLITDALAYSATDIFAAGFRDHEIGPILGVDDNTGAGGANVWSYALLEMLLAGKEPTLPTLPAGCDMRVAVRRTLRSNANAGMPLEDLGVVPDARHFLTRRDVLSANEDLIEHAARMI